VVKELTQECVDVTGQLRLIQRTIHQRHPAVARALIQLEGVMALPQAWMSALLNVARRAAKSTNEKVSQPLLGAFEIMRRVHRAKKVVRRHLSVEGANQPLKPVLADRRINIVEFQGSMVP